jgi:hypothetical protein
VSTSRTWRGEQARCIKAGIQEIARTGGDSLGDPRERGHFCSERLRVEFRHADLDRSAWIRIGNHQSIEAFHRKNRRAWTGSNGYRDTKISADEKQE